MHNWGEIMKLDSVMWSLNGEYTLVYRLRSIAVLFLWRLCARKSLLTTKVRTELKKFVKVLVGKCIMLTVAGFVFKQIKR